MDAQAPFVDWMTEIVNLLPVGFAFGAGMLSTVNPCGFAMVPAYISLYMGSSGENIQSRSLSSRGIRAFWITSVVSSGFLVLFGSAGILITMAGRTIAESIPWLAVLIGFGLIFLGIRMIAKRPLTATALLRLANRIGNPRSVSTLGFFLFGIAFGITSLSCALPIFLAVVGSALAANGIESVVIQFSSYSLGMGSVILTLSLGMTFFKHDLFVKNLRRVMPRLHYVTGSVVVLAGGYIVYYWLIQGNFLGTLRLT